MAARTAAKISLPRASVFRSLLEYVYTDDVDIAPEDAVEILMAADQYGLHRLKALAAVLIEKAVDTENVAWLYGTCPLCTHHHHHHPATTTKPITFNTSQSTLAIQADFLGNANSTRGPDATATDTMYSMGAFTATKPDSNGLCSVPTFTRAAQQMASANGIHALHGDGLMQLIQ